MRTITNRIEEHFEQVNLGKDDDVFILVLPQSKTRPEAFCLMFHERSYTLALRTLGRWASNPELTFSWCDAAVMSQAIRKTARDEGWVS